MAIVVVDDFIGRFMIPKTTYKVGELQDYIDRFTTPAIANLLGADLATAFIADLDVNGVPQSPEFLDLYNPFQKDDWFGVIISEGMKVYLLGIIYWWYNVESRIRPSAAGASGQPKSENTDNGNRPPAEHYQRYNTSISTGKAIQAFVEMNQEIYPTYNGQRLLYNSSI